MTELPADWVAEAKDLSEEQRRRFILVDNAPEGMAGDWDWDWLANDWDESELEDLGFDLSDATPAADEAEGQTDPDAVPEAGEEPISQTGEIYALGDHRLMCGDSTNADDVASLMCGEKAELVCADPPYGMGKEKDGVENDNLYRDKLDEFQMQWWQAFRAHLKDNASAYIWGNAEDLWRLWYTGGLGDSERFTIRNEIVWDKGDAGAGGISHQGAEGLRLYPQSTERCLFFMLGEQGFNNNADNYWEGWEPVRAYLQAECEKMGWGAEDIKRICGVGMYGHWFTKSQWTLIPEEHYKKLQEAAQGKAFERPYEQPKQTHDKLKQEHDRLKQEWYATRAYFDNAHDNMTDVWDFSRVTGADRHGHATPKPVDMIARILKSSCPDGGLVVEPFLGSGTTIIAAEKLGRKCYGMEISPRYCDVIRRRWAEYVHGEGCDWQGLTS